MIGTVNGPGDGLGFGLVELRRVGAKLVNHFSDIYGEFYSLKVIKSKSPLKVH